MRQGLWFRVILIAGSLTVAALLMALAFHIGTQSDWGQILVNLGSEVVGIVITVAVVESFLDRRRLYGRGRQLAWDTLHGIESGVWVWQGGPRELETDELLGILNAVGEEDALADFTEGMLLNVGTRCRRLLTNEPDAVASIPRFMNALEHLGRLSSIRDGRVPMAPRKIAEILSEGIVELARCLGQPTERHLASLIRYRDPSVASQERRNFGAHRDTWRSPEATTEG
jgi:hypothetical protein